MSNFTQESSAHLRDLLISRVIDGSASPEDWTSFRIMAASDTEVWTDLSNAQREHEALCEVMHAASSIADRTDLPGGSGSPLIFENRIKSASRWGGWAIAAVLLIGWFTGMFSPSLNQSAFENNTGINQAGLLPLGQASSEQAFGQYLEAGQSNGQVVGEMPDQIVVETRPMTNGSIEVIYIRQVIERRVLERAFREVADEFGNPSTVPVDLNQLNRTTAQ